MRRPCLSCGRLIEANASRCTDCQRAVWRQKNAQRPQFERMVYSSAEWKRLRAQVVADADGACFHCGAVGVPLSADHIVSVRDEPSLALEPSNLRAACRSCQRRRQEPRHR
jgi:5-methylcytosine-specific restriction endonuclease McrA